MRYTKAILLTALLACSPLFAEENPNPHQQLRDALVLEQQAHFDQTITIVTQLIDSKQLSGIELGRACIMLGFAYHQEGNFNASQNAFEHSLRILERDPEHVSDYADALNYYGSLYGDVGRFDAAEAMWLKALHLRQGIGDHTAAMHSLVNLASLALPQKRVHQANEYLKRASEEMKLAHGLTDDDFMVLFETQAWLALTEGHPSEAVAGFQHALELCQRSPNQPHWLPGWEQVLRGKAYAQSGDIDRALADMRQGLAILNELGPTNPKYFAAEIAYSQVLDRAGSHAQAAQLRAAAAQAGKDFFGSRCLGCTIDLAALR
jgi:tetratricopeptide (TPR) repeat protein